MAINKTYIQQLSYNGTSYSSGSVVDLYEKYHIVCQDFPFKKNPSPKDLPTRDWAGAHGLDVYIPDVIPMKEYEIEVTFLYVGTKANIRSDVSGFIDFIYGRVKGKSTDTVKSGRLAIYDEYVAMGRKDVVVSEVNNELYWATDADPDAIAQFKVKFKVYDPVTEVTATVASGQTAVTNLSFS